MKRRLLSLAAAIAVAGLASLFTARRIEAQYASPVRVTNSTSAPAIASVMDERGRIPYQSSVFNSTCLGSNFCNFTNFAAVPAGHRLVITQLSANFLVGTPQADTTLTVGIGGGASQTGFGHSWNVPIPASQAPVFFQPLTGYVDAGQSFVVTSQIGSGVLQNGTPTFSNLAHVTVTGYMLDCSAAPCSAIAN